MEIQTLYLIFAYIFTALFGVCVGSFLNVVIYRVPIGKSVIGNEEPSHCPKCGYKLKWYDNIPILSYIILGGKCRSCKQHITFRYTIVEAGNMLLWLLCLWAFFDVSAPITLVYAVLAMLACSVGLCVFFIDYEHTIIPDRFHFIYLGIGVGMLLYDLFSGHAVLAWYDRLIGLGGGLGLFLLIYFGALLVLKREGMGQGDVKFAAAIGFVLGWKALLVMVLIASLSASVVLVAVKLKNKEENGKEYPFGPFLVVGSWIALLAGNFLIDLYISLL